MDTGVYRCLDDEGVAIEGYTFNPELADYSDGMPYRVYHIAVPGKERPSVSVSDIKTVSLKKPYCKDQKIKYGGTVVLGPYLKDGLWFAVVRVPLYVKQGNAPALRSEFKLSVEFAGGATGNRPGARALSRVQNPKGASRFGIAVEGRRKALRREAASETPDVNFLAQFLIGDKDIATTAEDGIYAVSYRDIRTAMQEYMRQGDLYGIPVEKLRLYGANPDTLSDRVPGAETLHPQLFEIPIEVRDKQGNGIFDDGDSILFVGYGKNIWKRCDRDDPSFENGKMDYFYSVNPFSYFQYFALGWSETGKGLRMDKALKSPSGSGKNIDWLRYVRAEKDNFLRDTYFGKQLDYESSTGKEWFWFWSAKSDSTVLSEIDLTSGMPQVTDLKGLVEGGKQYASLSYFPRRSTWTSKVDKLGDQEVDQSMSEHPYRVRMADFHFDFVSNGKKFSSDKATLMPGGNFRVDNVGLKKSGNKFQITLLPNDTHFDRFDGFSLAYQWTPTVEKAEWFLPGKVSGIINIPVGTQSDIRVMKFVNFRPVGLLTVTNGVAKDSVAASDDVRYLAYREKQARSPKVVGIPSKLPGQLGNIAKINSETEYLIISPYDFLGQSLQLGQFRSDGSAVTTFKTTVVSVEDIYRMYTGGNISPIAIRNYIAYAYMVCPSLKYVLLVGSGHYDYKGIVVQSKNFMPPFEKEDAVVEDFFAVLDSGELVHREAYDLDLSVGRLPVKSSQDMNNYLNKIKEYEQVGKYDPGAWRSNVILTADDARNGTSDTDETNHTEYEEHVVSALDSMAILMNYRWNLKKIYLINYTYDAAGQKKEAMNDFLNILNQGALITNYFGHGSKTEWAAEGLLKSSYISRLSNKGRYTILNSFSCTVARFDDGKGRSLTEEFLLASGAGSIASVGATRETLGGHNRVYGRNVMAFALGESGIAYGDAYMKAKNIYALDTGKSDKRYNNERYVYLGEPVLRMPFANNKINLDQKLDTVKALDRMKLSGTVSGMNNGMINLAIREGRVNKKLGLDVMDKRLGQEDSISVDFDGALLYSEEVPVRSGRFETEFITPRKLNFGDTAAEFSAWAYSANEKSIARLFKTGIKISGMSSYADSIHDEVPPAISIQSCFSGGKATTFANSQHVKLQSPACLQVVIEDSTALDYREQADEGISFEVVGKEDPYHPYPYLEQSSKRAVLRKTFSAQNYPEGNYEFRVYASDVLGNSSDQELFIEITGELEEGLVDVFNIPNPMGKKGTTFYFKNLAVDRPSTVNIFIYNQNGRLVKVLKNAVSGVTHWDGRDNHGRKLANGLYHYVVRSEVPATADFKKSTWTKKQKLVISR